MARLPFSVAEQTIHVPLDEGDDAPAIDIYFNVRDEDTSRAEMVIIGKDGAPDIVIGFPRGGLKDKMEYRKQPEDDGGAANQRRNDRDKERIKAAKQAVEDFEKARHEDNSDVKEPDEHTKALAAMDLPVEPGEHPEPETRTVELNPNETVRRAPKANLMDDPMRPDEGKPENDPRRGLPAGDTGDAQRPSGLEPKDGDVITTTKGPATIPR